MTEEIDSTTGCGNYENYIDFSMSPDELAKFNVGDFWKVLGEFGKALCMIMEFFPSQELTFPHRVSEDCVLEFTVKKR